MNEALQDEIGVVAALEGGHVTVHFERSSACGKCGACGMLSDSSKTMVLTMDDPGGLAVGDSVRLVMKKKYFLGSTLLLYGIPMAALIIGVVLGNLIWGEAGQGLSALLGIALVGVCYLIYRLMNPKFLRWRTTQIALEKAPAAEEDLKGE